MDQAALAAAGRRIAQLARVVESSLGGMTLTAYRILSLVAEGNERSSQIAGRLALARPTVSNAVDQLVERGFIVRGATAEDRRAVVLTVTEAGRAALAEADASVADRLSPVFERLDDPDTAFAAIERVHTALNEVRADRLRKAAAERAAAAGDTSA